MREHFDEALSRLEEKTVLKEQDRFVVYLSAFYLLMEEHAGEPYDGIHNEPMFLRFMGGGTVYEGDAEPHLPNLLFQKALKAKLRLQTMGRRDLVSKSELYVNQTFGKRKGDVHGTI